MKKFFVVVLAMVCLLNVVQLSAAAAPIEPEEKVEVSVSYVKKGSIPELSSSGFRNSGISLCTVDLSDDIISFDWTLDSKKSNTTGTCKTNTTKIVIPFEGDRTGSVKIELLNASGTSLAESTVKFDIVDDSSPVVTFNHLTSSNTYKVKITNLNLFQMRVYGAVKEKLWF